MPDESRFRTHGIRRLSLADLTDDGLRRLVDSGEDLFVERKQAIPTAGLGRVVASFANSLGGWVLLGVADNGSLVGYDSGRTDAQAHFGQLLANEVDPPPPFVASRRQLDGVSLVVLRVFESADTPHVLRVTGSIPIRTPKGTESVGSQSLLIELARRGEAALEKAHNRMRSDLMTLELSTFDRPDLAAVNEGEPFAVVRVSPLTVTAQFSDWAISEQAAESVVRTAGSVASFLGVAAEDLSLTARGRGVAAGWTGGFQVPVSCRVAIDSGGSIGARIGRGVGDGRESVGGFRAHYISPMTQALSDLLREAEVYGRSSWRVDINVPRANFHVGGAERTVAHFYATREMGSPPSSSEASGLADVWGREFARELGFHEWN